MLGTGDPDVLLDVERVNLDLVDDRRDARVRSHQLLDLMIVSDPACAPLSSIGTYMSGTIVADTARPDLAGVDSILEGLPAGEPGLFAAVGTV